MTTAKTTTAKTAPKTARKTTRPAAAKAKIAPDLSKVQAKAREVAKDVYAKGADALEDIKGFTKGNVEAVAISGKILGAGLKGMGATYAAEGRSALETAKADLAELKTVKSPADFFKLHTKIVSRNLKTAMDMGQKNSAAFIKLAQDVSTPLAHRVEVAVAAVRKAA